MGFVAYFPMGFVAYFLSSSSIRARRALSLGPVNNPPQCQKRPKVETKETYQEAKETCQVMFPELFFLAAELRKLFLLPKDKLLVFLGLESALDFCLHVVD